jgi:4-amino-4-deoxy-L-arabinose transferase-like glycosyltransferase
MAHAIVVAVLCVTLDQASAQARSPTTLGAVARAVLERHSKLQRLVVDGYLTGDKPWGRQTDRFVAAFDHGRCFLDFAHDTPRGAAPWRDTARFQLWITPDNCVGLLPFARRLETNGGEELREYWRSPYCLAIGWHPGREFFGKDDDRQMYLDEIFASDRADELLLLDAGSEANGEKCVLIETKPGGNHLWLGREIGFAVVRRVNSNRVPGEPSAMQTTTTDCTDFRRVIDGVWLPYNVDIETALARNQAETDRRSVHLDIDRIGVNGAVLDDLFEFQAPPGTITVDKGGRIVDFEPGGEDLLDLWAVICSDAFPRVQGTLVAPVAVGLSIAAVLTTIMGALGLNRSRPLSLSRIAARVVTQRTIVLCLVASHAGLVAYSALRHSPTLNEPEALVAGISHWKFSRFDLFRENPPLVRMIAALPAISAGFNEDWSGFSASPELRPALSMGQRFAAANGERVLWLTSLARWACIPFSLIGAGVCFLWARELYGRGAALLALTLWCFSPNVLAHAALMTPDIGATALGAAAWYAFWMWLRKATWRRAIVFGLLLGIAELAKTTLLVLYPLAAVLWLLRRLTDRGVRQRMRLGGQLCMLAVAVAVSIYVLNLGYQFEGTCRRLGQFDFVSNALAGENRSLGTGNRFRHSWFGAMPVPVPANYLQGIDVQRADFEHFDLPSYLAGEWRSTGWWYYYLYGLAVKVPIGTWALVVLAAVARCTNGWRRSRDDAVVLAPLLAILVLVSSQTGLNHHFRYVLPIAPYAFVWVSAAVICRAKLVRAAALVALLGTVLSSLAVYPHSLSYFNELAGGPRGGADHLIHSSIDWGQDLTYLKEWLLQHPEARPLRLAYYGPLDPSCLGIEYSFPKFSLSEKPPHRSQLSLEPGWYAVSTNFVRGAPFRAPAGRGRVEWLTPGACVELLEHKPAATAGFSIDIYHITGEEGNRAH